MYRSKATYQIHESAITTMPGDNLPAKSCSKIMIIGMKNGFGHL